MKTGPGTNRRLIPVAGAPSRMLAPVTSLGSRSGVPWIRPKPSPSARAKARARSVLPTPGTSSISAWPSASRAIARSRSGSSASDDGHGHAVAQGTEGPGAVAAAAAGSGRAGAVGWASASGWASVTRASVRADGSPKGTSPARPRVHSPERPVCGRMRPMAGREVPIRSEPGFSLPAFGRLAPPPPPELVAARIEEHSSLGDVVVDLHGRGGWIARAAVDRQRRAASLETSPLTRLLAEVVLRPPDVRHLDAAFQAISAAPARAIGPQGLARREVRQPLRDLRSERGARRDRLGDRPGRRPASRPQALPLHGLP